MSDGLTFVLLALAAYRAWRFLALDTLPLIAGPRDRVEDAIAGRFGEDWADGIKCAWCLGAWCCIGVFIAADVYGVSIPLPVVQIAAASTLVGVVAMTVED